MAMPCDCPWPTPPFKVPWFLVGMCVSVIAKPRGLWLGVDSCLPFFLGRLAVVFSAWLASRNEADWCFQLYDLIAASLPQVCWWEYFVTPSDPSNIFGVLLCWTAEMLNRPLFDVVLITLPTPP